ncbi:MAG: ATPase, T2SS/T4P/T4SS family [Verrucomicrobium sp.]|nr:ATPase, T2SS/T4P/T4SS family [Verrucomicrobium sp.]
MKFECGIKLSETTASMVTRSISDWWGSANGYTDEEIGRRATGEDVAGAFSMLTGLPVLRRPHRFWDEELVGQFDNTFLREAQAVPIAHFDNCVTMGTVDPYNNLLPDLLSEKFPQAVVQKVIIPIEDLSICLSEVKTETESQDDVDLSTVESANTDSHVLDFSLDEPQDGAIEQRLQKIFIECLAARASDIHFVTERERFYYEYRVDGDIDREIDLPPRLSKNFDSVMIHLFNGRLDAIRTPMEGRFTISTNGRRINIRYERHPTHFGFHVTLRILDGNISRPKLGDPGLIFHPKVQLWMNRLLDAPEGLVVMSGPTGSGKTTTLNAMIQEINRSKYNILTLENPVEIEIAGVKQVNLKQLDQAPLYLSSFLRSDPDIILIGEVRDSKTANLAAQAANTGHLVLTSVHTSSAALVIDRFINLGLERWQVSETIIGAFAQRLVQTLCPACAIRDVEITPGEVERYNLDPSWTGKKVNKLNKKGCAECRERGFGGRQALLEVIPITGNIRNLINKAATSAELMTFMKAEYDLPSLRDVGLELVESGLVDLYSLNEVVSLALH